MTTPETHDDRDPVDAQTASDHETMTDVLDDWAEEGITVSFRPGDEPATIRCPVCDITSPAGDFDVIRERRLEGASDPDDMVLGIAARCPVCHISGAIVLGFGAEASGEDADIVAELPSPPAG